MMICFESENGQLFANKKPFFVKGLNYFGMESDICVPHGLWGGTGNAATGSFTVEFLAKFMKQNHFNAIRLPFAVDKILSNDLIDPSKLCTWKAFPCQEQPIRYFDVLDSFIMQMAQHQILIVLDAHLLEAGSQIPPLWYNSTVSELDLINAWTALARRYKDQWNVMGADLNNEPHSEAAWGTQNSTYDWNSAAERIGNSILQVSPRWMIFVEGVSGNIPEQTIQPSFWGGNFQGVHQNPICLCVPNRLVYSPHVYGPSVHRQPYFDNMYEANSNFPKKIVDIWEEQFGFLSALYNKFSCVIIGEWGGKNIDEDKIWQDSFVKYLLENKQSKIGFFYWCFNPNSGDTGGLVEDDWVTFVNTKLKLLSKFKGTDVSKI